MKQVKIAELKAGLSGYLAEVRNGERFVVCDRSTPIALLAPLGETPEGELARGAPIALPHIHPVKLRGRVDVVAVLAESREER